MIEIKISAIVVAVAAAGSLYGWAVLASTVSHPGSIGVNLNAPGGDWTVFYAAVQSFYNGHLGLISTVTGSRHI